MSKEAKTEVERAVYSIGKWIKRYEISRSACYTMMAEGRGPKLLRVGGRVLISKEADDAWRRAHEAA